MAEKGINIPQVFGEVVRDLRKEKGVTQEDLAELSGLHTNYISLLERGNRQPTINTIFKLASAFEMKPFKMIQKVEEKLKNTSHKD